MNLTALFDSSVNRETDSPIRTSADLNRTIASWKRFNEVKRPGSTKPAALDTGEVVPEYFVRERRNQVAQENRRRNAAKRNLYPDWDELDAVERATAMANKNLHPVEHPPGWENPLDKLGKFGVLGRSDQVYSTRYTDTIESLYSNDPAMMEVVEIVERIALENPEALRLIFDNPMYDDVTSMSFIYDASKSPFRTPWEDDEFMGKREKGRRTQVIEFWRERAREYL